MAVNKKPSAKPTRTAKGGPKKTGKPKARRAPKKSGMDSDTKTITKILIGLVGILVIVGGMVGAYEFFKPEDKKIAAASPTGAGSIALPDKPSPQAMSAMHGIVETASGPSEEVAAFARRTSEGPSSTFNPEQAFEPGEVIVADPPRGFEDKIRAKGFHVSEHIRLPNLGLNLARVATPAGMSIEDAVKVLSREMPGTTIDVNSQFDPTAAGTAQYGANARAMAGWEDLSPTCGKGLVLGQIDSGIDVTHPALKASDLTYRSYPKSGRQPGPPDHGTSVAAMLVGSPQWGGLLPGAKLYAVNMFEINEEGKTVGSAIALLRGLDWLLSQRVHAINLSIAGSNNKVLTKAFDAARMNRTILVAAVGNWGRNDKPAYPAAFGHVVAVTATKGPELIYKHANTGDYVDFSAPGVGIYTAIPGGGGKAQSGTSFATPYVTAMAAILSHAGKTPNADTLRKLLAPVTRDLGRPGKDNIFGFGSLKVRPVCR